MSTREMDPRTSARRPLPWVRAAALVAWGLVLIAACAAPASPSPPSPPSAVVVTVPEAATSAPTATSEPVAPGGAPSSQVSSVSAVPLELPKATDFEDTSITLGVELTKDGSIFVDGQRVASDEELRQRARAVVQAHGDARAVIRADRDTRYGQVIHVLDQLKQAGVVKIAFGVEPMPAPPPAAP
jgi:biopolymer transport protein ExbD